MLMVLPLATVFAIPAPATRAQPTSPGAGPVVVLETVKGTIEFETYPKEAPKTVARIVELVNKGFYNGLSFHRVEPNFIVQLGDPKSRDMTRSSGRDVTEVARRSAWPRSPRHAPTSRARSRWPTGLPQRRRQPVLNHPTPSPGAQRQVPCSAG